MSSSHWNSKKCVSQDEECILNSNHVINLELRLRMIKYYIFSIFLSGMEVWPLTETRIRRIEIFQMWIYWRVLKISWTDHNTNVEVLNPMHTKTEIVNTIEIRKLTLFGQWANKSITSYNLLYKEKMKVDRVLEEDVHIGWRTWHSDMGKHR